MRRDRPLLLDGFLNHRVAVVLLTLLGAASESLGVERRLSKNTLAKRSHSLFRQGSMWFDLISKMPERCRKALVTR